MKRDRGDGLAATPTLPVQPAVLVLDMSYPQTDRDSGSVSTMNYMRLFAELGYRVVFAAADEYDPLHLFLARLESMGVNRVGPERFSSIDELLEQEGEYDALHLFRARLESMGVSCVGPERFSSIDELLEREGETFAICFLCRVDAGGRFMEAARRHCRAGKIVFDLVDLHYLRGQREAQLAGHESRMDDIAELKARELALVREADASIVVSHVEKRILDAAVPGARVWYMPLVRECQGRAGPFRGRAGIGFVGNFSHTPNVDAVRYFLAEIWPLVSVQLPETQFSIIGSRLPEEFARLDKPGVKPIGHVPDLAAPLANLRLTVAPLRYGAGAKGKIVSSLAHGVPCVVSEIAAEGMELTDGKHVLIGRDPAHFAEQIVQLHEDEALWNSLSEAGLARVQEHHSFKAGRARMRKLLEEIQAV